MNLNTARGAAAHPRRFIIAAVNWQRRWRSHLMHTATAYPALFIIVSVGCSYHLNLLRLLIWKSVCLDFLPGCKQYLCIFRLIRWKGSVTYESQCRCSFLNTCRTYSALAFRLWLANSTNVYFSLVLLWILEADSSAAMLPVYESGKGGGTLSEISWEVNATPEEVRRLAFALFCLH